ncbi:MAG: hypothetical protein ORN56_01980 [Chitinophagales bacterium]|nr:hypothetical protein [Chitinophagales bacterium]
MKTIKFYVDNWNDWHLKWFKLLSTGTPEKIKDFPIPSTNNKYLLGNQMQPMYKYFPEPFLHYGPKSNIKHIFLNINPGGASETQDFDQKTNNELFDIYLNCYNNYTAFMDEFLKRSKINSKSNATSKWYANRIKWTESIYGKQSEGTVLCADLIPWHSKKESDVTHYIKKHQKSIFKYVIEPLMNIAFEIEDKDPKIIVRGVAFFDLINSWLLDRQVKLQEKSKKNKNSPRIELIKEKFENEIDVQKRSIEQYIVMDCEDKFFDKFNSYLTKYKFTHKSKSVTFIIFSGGANMDLPKAKHKVFKISNTIGSLGNNGLTLKKFLGN